MKEQHIERYDGTYYSDVVEMQSEIEDHIKRGWCVKCMCNTASKYVIVVYEKEAVAVNLENIGEKIKI